MSQSTKITPTEAWYDQKGDEFFERTAFLQVEALHRPFLSLLSPGARILDAGCGSGRDARLFSLAGFQVTAFDASRKMAELAQVHSGLPVQQLRFRDVTFEGEFDGVWASASLLHVPLVELRDSIQPLIRALRPGGILFCSFKAGTGERVARGRHFTDFTAHTLSEFLSQFAALSILKVWEEADSRPEIRERWVSALCRKRSETV